MKRREKSLRQMAREMGVSHSYLSQIINGKRPASKKVVSKMVSNYDADMGKYDKILSLSNRGEVSELADEHDLGSCAERRGGSNPPFPISIKVESVLTNG